MPGDRPKLNKKQVASYIAATVTDEDGNIVSQTGAWHDAQGHEITDPAVIADLDSRHPIGGYKRGDSVSIRMGDSNKWTAGVVQFYHGAGTWIVSVHGKRIGVPHTHIKARD